MTREEAEQARSREIGEARARYDKATARIHAAFRKVDEWHTGVWIKHSKAFQVREKHPVAWKNAEQSLQEAMDKLYAAYAVREAKRKPYEKVWHRAIARINRKYDRYSMVRAEKRIDRKYPRCA